MSHHHHYHHRHHRHVKLNSIPPPPPPPPTPVQIDTTSLPDAGQNVSYVATVMASGGVLPYTFSIISGSLPTGLSMNSAGLISGTPTGTGTSNFTVKVQDSADPVQSDTAPLSITVSGSPPPPIVRGLFAFAPNSTSIPTSVLTNPKIKGVSIAIGMADVVAGNWTVFDALCAQVAAAGKKLLVRVGGQGNSVHNGGTIPDAWYTAIGASPTTLDIYPGKTYTFNQPGTPIIVRCIPVFYNPDYVALRLTAIATFWAHIATLSAQIRAAITHSNVQLCESQHDDWSIATRTVIDNVGGPNGTGYDRSEYHRWIDSVMAGGAGYTSAAMLDQAKQNMIAMVNGADAAGLSATVKFFAPFGTIGPSNTTALDLAAATTEGYPYPQLYMIHKITDWANATYPGRFLLARESLAACNMVDANLAAVGGAPWYWLQNATAVGGANAAQMLWNTHNDSTFRNNGGNNINCKRGSDPRYPNLVSTEQDIMDQCFDHGGHTQVGFQCEIVEPYLVDCTGAIDLTWGASQIDP